MFDITNEELTTMIVNSGNDLGMAHRELIGEKVKFIKVCKSGLYYVKDKSGKFHSLPKHNLDHDVVGVNHGFLKKDGVFPNFYTCTARVDKVEEKHNAIKNSIVASKNIYLESTDPVTVTILTIDNLDDFREYKHINTIELHGHNRTIFTPDGFDGLITINKLTTRVVFSGCLECIKNYTPLYNERQVKVKPILEEGMSDSDIGLWKELYRRYEHALNCQDKCNEKAYWHQVLDMTNKLDRFTYHTKLEIHNYTVIELNRLYRESYY